MSLEHTPDFVKQQKPSRDGFLGGRLTLEQPRRGFRAGLDSVLLGAAPRLASTTLLDLGAGVGTAALCAMVHAPGLTATLVEGDQEMLALAALNLAANGFAGRGRVLALDVTAPGKARAAAGLPNDHFTTVIANPPFFVEGRGTRPEAARRAARHQPGEALDLWVRTAAAHAAPGGEVIFIHPAETLPALLASFGRRLGALTVLPFVPREGGAASRVLVRGIKGSRAPLTLLASRALHIDGAGAFTPGIASILAGEARLDW
jgi:tRNA1(Val) A37 N6-methylase TrmN6